MEENKKNFGIRGDDFSQTLQFIRKWFFENADQIFNKKEEEVALCVLQIWSSD